MLQDGHCPWSCLPSVSLWPRHSVASGYDFFIYLSMWHLLCASTFLSAGNKAGKIQTNSLPALMGLIISPVRVGEGLVVNINKSMKSANKSYRAKQIRIGGCRVTEESYLSS